ncbi:uncharacterized protein [Euwallacea similis]|uniref:uncharacterized protein n=1 Tax=Euwallacea similis TaxID=1736056 RepID=UPI0034508DC8
MKVFVVFSLTFAVIFASIIPEEIKDELEEVSEKCREENNPTLEKETVKQYLETKGQEPVLENLGPYALCLSKGMKWQTQDGKVNKQYLRPRLEGYVKDTVKADKIFSECDFDRESEIETAKIMLRCYAKYFYQKRQIILNIGKVTEMKLFVAVVFCITFATVFGDFREELRAKIKKAGDKCQEDPATAVDKEALKTYLESKGTSPEPANSGVHALCVTKELKWQKADGKVDREYLKERLQAHQQDPVKSEEFLNECAVDKDTDIDTAKHLFKCFYKRYPSTK